MSQAYISGVGPDAPLLNHYIRINLGVFAVRNPALLSRKFGIEEFEGSPFVWLPFVSRLLSGLENGPVSVNHLHIYEYKKGSPTSQNELNLYDLGEFHSF